ncbi:protein of unknown function [Candidatus Nitrosocosmicus franklandus]|uniref:Uncharacterized protein n=1 Tax=Candidatus Nitrosocosmicus franklandianus TaxID=1798806 RepID=A0A484I670_9ARCH|nr:protein of unknown function [Candidatus Nitrosocosmicus franklandus]
MFLCSLVFIFSCNSSIFSLGAKRPHPLQIKFFVIPSKLRLPPHSGQNLTNSVLYRELYKNVLNQLDFSLVKNLDTWIFVFIPNSWSVRPSKTMCRDNLNVQYSL